MGGVCTSRDIIGITKSERYSVNAYFQLSIPPAFINKGLDNLQTISKEEVLKPNISNFWRKTLAAEYNGTLLEIFNKSTSDWIIVDLRSILKGNYVVNVDGKQYAYSFHFYNDDVSFRNNIIKYWKNNGKIIDNADIKKIDFLDLSNNDEIFDEFCSFLKKRYGKKIILLSLRQAEYIIKGNEEVRHYEPQERNFNNLILDKYTNIFLEKVDCYCIHVPPNIIADHCHDLWGPGDVHYVREFYDYGLECLDVITSSVQNKLHQLNRIYAKYIMLFNQIRCGLSFTEYSTVHYFDSLIKNCNSEKDFAIIVSNFESLNNKNGSARLLGEIEGRIGRAYRDGKGVDKDLIKAAEWMRNAANKNIGWAKNELFDILWRIDTSESHKEMILVATAFAESGDGAAMGRMGRAYRDGKGVDKDLIKAAEWMRNAANKNIGWAKNELTVIEEKLTEK